MNTNMSLKVSRLCNRFNCAKRKWFSQTLSNSFCRNKVFFPFDFYIFL